MQMSRKKVLKSLTEKGFEKREGSSHSVLFYRNTHGKKTGIRTVISRGKEYRSLGPSIMSIMADQCGLSNTQFRDFIDCTISKHEYDSLVKRVG